MPQKRIFSILLFLLIAPVIILICLQLSITFYFNDKIKNELQKEVNSQTQGEYELKIEKLNTNIFDQSIFLSGFSLIPVKDINSNAPKYFSSASEINLVNFDLTAFLFKRDLIVDKMELLNPTGNIFRSTKGYYKPAMDTVNRFSIYNLISKQVNSLTIKKIEIRNADIKIFDDVRDSIPSISSKDNELRISDLQINKSSDQARRFFLAEKIELVIKRFSYTTKDSLYSVLVKNLTASYNDSTLILDSLELIPNYSKKQFADEAGAQTDRMKISASKAEFNSMNVKLFFERNWFIASQLNIEGLNVSAYRDKNDIRKPVKPKSVQLLIKSIPFYTSISSIHLTNAFVKYEEVAEGATKPGYITFNNVNATIRGLTNDSSLMDNNFILKVKASCKFMNKGKLTADYNFPMKTNDMVFSCDGKLNNMPFDAVNSILEPNANVSIKGGMIDSMIFSFTADDFKSRGRLKFIYHGLKIEFRNKKSKRTGVLEDALSFLVHRLIIKEDNPSHNQAVRLTEINYGRNPYRFIFNYSWKSLLSGIKPAMGMPELSSKRKKKK